MILLERILDHLKKNGQMTIDEYLNMCLHDKDNGYYHSQNVLGKNGDFITAPEMTQIFGELIATFIMDQWHQAGEGNPIHLIECGPGRGVLMQDMLRTFKKFPSFYDNLRISMVECSSVLRMIQKTCFDTDIDICWYNDLEDVPCFNGYTFIVANEFFDALPIKQFVNKDGCLTERLITLNDQNHIRFNMNDDKNLIEDCPAYEDVISAMNRHLEMTEGGILIVDYGDFEKNRYGDTLQAIKNHHYASIFDTPGETDISHQVNFRKLSHLLSSRLNQSVIYTQGEFLQLLGIEKRMQTLLTQATPAQKMQVLSACARLISPQHMGTIFKVLFASTHDSTFCQF
ncbi:MAG: hypothetical protein HEEMFOPI_01544 [Holosporales bacterium]